MVLSFSRLRSATELFMTLWVGQPANESIFINLASIIKALTLAIAGPNSGKVDIPLTIGTAKDG